MEHRNTRSAQSGRKRTRKELAKDYSNDPQSFLKEAKERGVPLSEVFRIRSEPSDPHGPNDALVDVMHEMELRAESNKNYESSTLGEFTRTEAGTFLLFDYLDRCYEDTLLGRADDDGSTGFDESNFLAGQVYRPYYERPLVQRKRISPQVRISDIVARVETVTEDLIRQPEFTTNVDTLTTAEKDLGTAGSRRSANEEMIPIAPGGKIPTTVVSLGSRTAELKKVGIGLAVTDEFNSNNIRVSAIQTWVERVAVNHERAIVNEGVKTIIEGPNALTGNMPSPLTGANRVEIDNDLGGIIEVNTYFDDPYMLDMLITSKSVAREWIEVNVTAGGAGTNSFLPYPAGRFNDVFANINVVNVNSQPTRLAYLSSPTSATGIPDSGGNHMLGIDSRVTLVMYRHARGSVNERERIPSQQIEARYMTERYGFMLEDINSRALFYWT